MGEENQSLVVDLTPGETIQAAPDSVIRGQPLNGVAVTSKTTRDTIVSDFVGPRVEEVSNTTANDVKVLLGTMHDDHQIARPSIYDNDELFCEMKSFLCASKSVKVEEVRSGSYFGRLFKHRGYSLVLSKVVGKR